MIEIELRYKITKEPNLDNFTFKSEKVQKDVYYDTPNYSMLSSGNFMRTRNDKRIDFKLEVGDLKHNFCKETSFDVTEINGRNKDFLNVFKSLAIDINNDFNSFDDFIKANEFLVLAPIIKQRKSYTNGEMNIAIDKVNDIGQFLEAEVMIDDNEDTDIDAILEQIEQTLISNNIIAKGAAKQSVGYVELYLLEHNKPVYELGKFKT